MGISFYKDIYGMLSRKYPNRKIYIISDHHFFHSNIIKYGRENFCDVFDMNKQIIFKHNQIIDKEDIVIFLGDFCFKKSAIKPILEQMNGHKFLLLGNHDQPELTRIYGKMGFEGIFTEPVKLDGDYLSHQPLCKEEATNTNFKLLVNEFLKDNINTNYHGHIHTSENISQHHINVSCEATDYMPIAIGYTNGIKDNGALLPINSKHFEHILNLFKEEKNLEPTLLITDYIYSMMLASNKKYSGSIFVYGSFLYIKNMVIYLIFLI